MGLCFTQQYSLPSYSDGDACQNVTGSASMSGAGSLPSWVTFDNNRFTFAPDSNDVLGSLTHKTFIFYVKLDDGHDSSIS
jgi:hypothetical protein